MFCLIEAVAHACSCISLKMITVGCYGVEKQEEKTIMLNLDNDFPEKNP